MEISNFNQHIITLASKLPLLPSRQPPPGTASRDCARSPQTLDNRHGRRRFYRQFRDLRLSRRTQRRPPPGMPPRHLQPLSNSQANI